MSEESHDHSWIHRLDRSVWQTVLGVIALFATAILVTLIAPQYVDSTWMDPTSAYQQQMYEIADPHFYMSSRATGGKTLQFVRHLQAGETLIAFQEHPDLYIVTSPELIQYVTPRGEQTLRLTSRVLFLREPTDSNLVEAKLQQIRDRWGDEGKGSEELKHQIFELHDPQLEEGFAWDPSGGVLQDWAGNNFLLLDENIRLPYSMEEGVIYFQNPREFRVVFQTTPQGDVRWRYSPEGERVKNVEQIRSPNMGFYSREELIALGEHLYAIEGCWYCHSDQTRTLIQDTVLNGSAEFPAPPSSSNEYIYQKISFLSTRRIGPDLSRVGIKRPSRDWHKAHFWSPKTASAGSIMPAFRHFFDNDPRGTRPGEIGIPNWKFEAMYQYLLTKGTRLSAPDEAWWEGKDRLQTMKIIEGRH